MRATGLRVTVLILILAVSGSSLSADPVTAESPQAAAIDSTAMTGAEQEVMAPSLTETVLPSLGRIGLSLLVIVFFIYGVVFLLKKLSGNRLGGVGRGKAVRVIEQTYLAPKKSVCLLKLADRAILVGVTESTINLLTEFDWESVPEASLSADKNGRTSFSGLLGEATGRLFARKSGGTDHETVR